MLTFTPLDAEQDAAPQASSELTFVPISEEPAKPEAPAATPAPAERKEGSFIGELVKGAKGAFEYTIPSMGRQLALQGSADAMMAKQKQLALMDKIDKGEIKSLRELRADPAYEELSGAGQLLGQLNAYFANRGVPEVAAKLRGGVQKDFTNMAQSTATQIDVLNRYAKEHKAKYGANVEKFTDINWTDPKVVSDFTQWLGYNMGAGATQLVPIMVAAAVTKQPGLLATSGAMGVSEAVGNRMKFIQNKTKGMPPEEQGRAIAEYVAKTGDTNLITGLAAGSFDLLLGPAAKAAKGALAQSTRELGKVAAMKKAAKELPKDVLQEGITGGLQEATQIAAKKKLEEEGRPVTLQNIKDVINAMAAEAAGAPAGTAVNVGRAGLFTPSAPQEVPEVTPPSTVDELAAKLESQGFPAAEARKIAEARMAPPQESEADREARLEREAIQAENEPLTFVPLGEEGTPVPKAAPAEEAPTLESLTGEFIDQGLSEEEARVQAQLVLDREKPVVTTPPTPPSTIKAEAPPTQASVAQELIDQGYSEQEAQVLARLYMMRQEGQVAPTEGESRAARPDTTADRGGVEVPAQPAVSVPAAEGVEGVEPTGVVPVGQDVGRVAEGEGTQPSALTAEEIEADYQKRKAAAIDFAKRSIGTAKDTQDDYRSLKDALDAHRENVADTLNEQGETEPAVLNAALNAYDREADRILGTETPTTIGEPLGTEAPEAVQAEAQGQEAPAAPAVTEAGKKRGRPAVLSPEEKAAREEQRKTDRAERGRHERALNKAEAALQKASEPLDEGEFANEAELKEAQDDQRAERRNAIKELLKVSEESGLRPEGKRARQVLKDANVPQTEIDDIKRGLERAKKALSEDKNNVLGPFANAGSRRGAQVAPADAGFSGLTTGLQAIGHVIRTGNAFQKLVGLRIRNALKNVRFVVVEDGQQLPAELRTKKNAAAWERSRAIYLHGNKTVYVRGASFGNSQGANTVTVLHELLHAATAAKIEAAKVFVEQGIQLNTPLVQAYMDLVNTMRNAQEEYFSLNDAGAIPPEIVDLLDSTDFSIITDPHEFLAYGMSDADFQEFLLNAEGETRNSNLFTKFVKAIAKFFGIPPNYESALIDLVLTTDALLSARIPSGAQLALDAPPLPQKTPKRGKFETSQEATDFDDVSSLKKAWAVLDNAGRELIVRIPSFEVLANWAKDAGIPRIETVQLQTQEMGGMATKLMKGGNQIVQQLRRTLNAHPFERERLADVVYSSTLEEYDPSKTAPTTAEAKRIFGLYNSLSPDSRRMYTVLRDYHSDIRDLNRQILDDSIENLDVDADIKKNLMGMIRKSFETEKTIEPFFPLIRYGDFWVTANVKGERQVFTFENSATRKAFVKKLAASGAKDIRTGNGMSALRGETQEASQLLTQMFAAIDAQFDKMAGATPTEDTATDNAKAKESLKDAVYQLYLETMPERSFRNMFKHRKGRAGFSTDLVRNTATYVARTSKGLSRLKYAPILRRELAAAQDSIEGRPELSPFVEEARRRVNLAMSGSGGGFLDAVAGYANKIAFIYYMTSWASAFLQPFSIALSGLPVIAANQHSWARASYELARLVADMRQYTVKVKNIDGTISWTAPTLIDSPNITEDERRALQEMTSRGIEENTYASTVWGYSRMPSANIDSVSGKAKDLSNVLIAGLIHNTERLTREITYLASYRVARSRGLTHEEAVTQAVADTNEALSNYAKENRPRWMQSGIGKMMGQFDMYPLHMLSLMLTNFKRMILPLPAEGRAVAVQKFFGMMGMSFILGGLANTMLFSPLMAMLGAAWKELEEGEWPEELRELDFITWFRTVYLPNKLKGIEFLGEPLATVLDRGIINAKTGWDVGSRVGLNDVTNIITGRGGKETKTERDALNAWVMDQAPPVVNVGFSVADAIRAAKEGDKERAADKVMPSGLRNLAIAHRYYKEGVKDYNGAVLIPKEGPSSLTFGELLGQAIGFKPDRVAFAQQQAFRLNAAEQKVVNERDLIMRRMNVAIKNGDQEEFKKIVRTEAREFNAKHPSNEIEVDDIFRSIENNVERRLTARAGINLTEKNVKRLRQSADNLQDILLKSHLNEKPSETPAK